MQVLEVYKKLPKTNCGDCGESSCMAFALKVHTGQRTISGCTHLRDATGAPGQATVNTVEDAYAHASNRLQEQLRTADFREAAATIGGLYDEQRDSITLAVLNTPHEVRREGLFAAGAPCHDSWTKLIVYDYVLRKGAAPLTGVRVPFDQFPGTPSHVKTFHKRAESELAHVFATDPDRLRTRLHALGGVEVHDEAKAALTIRLTLLPNVPLYLQFQTADEDFQASCKLFVDRNATRNLDVEYIARLVAKCVAKVTGTDSA